MFGFNLGREYKLSIAEIISLFPNSKKVFFDKSILLVDNIDEKDLISKANFLGGTIKIIKIFNFDILSDALKENGKFSYGINVYGKNGANKEMLQKTKSELKSNNIKSRYINIDNKNLNSAQILGEGLVIKQTDYNYIFAGDKIYKGKTIWVQNINNYSSRDYSKERDMQTGMLPPKLAQIMINLGNKKESIYDPFVGLGTVLIEAALMGFYKLYGTDINDRMVEFSKSNLEKFLKDNDINIKKLFIGKLNAKFINEFSYFSNGEINLIVTEGYLGEIMTQKNISIDRINKQKQFLKELYLNFFQNLTETSFDGNIVISFPFWEFEGKYIYLTEIYEIINTYTKPIDFFNDDFKDLRTKTGSLLYKRDKQLVGREIFKLSLK